MTAFLKLVLINQSNLLFNFKNYFANIQKVIPVIKIRLDFTFNRRNIVFKVS